VEGVRSDLNNDAIHSIRGYFRKAQDLKRIASAAGAEAIANDWAVTIAIVDDGDHLLWQQRLDDAAPLTTQIAPAKAAPLP
jgi:uncharacterized protein GlcG (DUF336 family)